MVTMGKRNIFLDRDGWTVRTVDRKNAAHFEKAIFIRQDGMAEELTSYKEIEVNLRKMGFWIS